MLTTRRDRFMTMIFLLEYNFHLYIPPCSNSSGKLPAHMLFQPILLIGNDCCDIPSNVQHEAMGIFNQIHQHRRYAITNTLFVQILPHKMPPEHVPCMTSVVMEPRAALSRLERYQIRCKSRRQVLCVS